ncbi:hypothetical protein BMF94_6192 [Rhodotorula taiwanensis]|uniref:Uncharacterized protein n=1 Tax=Rhodotorula taiwanensis TaxID=741276 RepID=A0A2S5B1Y5_9BASI|nr:hypothetical protein BMF94_6192 [Rhodotorula taiwanensis]
MGSMPIRQTQDDDASDDEILLVAPLLATTSAASLRTPAAAAHSNNRQEAPPSERATRAKGPRRSEPYLCLPSNNNSSTKQTRDAANRSAKRRKTLADLPTAAGLVLSRDGPGAVVLTPPVSKSNGPTSRISSPVPVRQHTRWTDDASGSSSKRISYYSPPQSKRAAPPPTSSSSLLELSSKQDGLVADRPSSSSAPPSKRKRTRSPTFDLTITRSPPSKSGSNSPPGRGAKRKEVEAHLPSPVSLPSPPLPTVATAAIGSENFRAAAATAPDPGSQPPSKRKSSSRSPPQSTTFELVVPARARPPRRSVTPQAQARLSEVEAQGPLRGSATTSVVPPLPPFPNKPAQHPLNSLRLRPPPALPALSRFWRNDDFPPARDLGGWIAPCAVAAKGKGRMTMTSSRSREETPISAAVTAVFSAAVQSDGAGTSIAAVARLAVSTDAGAIASTSRLPTPAVPLTKPTVAKPPSFKSWMKRRYEFLEPYETSRYKIDGSTLGLDPDPLSYEWDEDELWSDYEERYGWEERERVARGEEEEVEEEDDDEGSQQDLDGEDAELPPPRPRMACTVGEGPDVMFGSEYISKLCSTAITTGTEAPSAEALAAADHLNELTQSRGLVRQFPWRWRSLEEGKGRAGNAATKWATRNPYMRGEPDPYEQSHGRRTTHRARKALEDKARLGPAQRTMGVLRVSPSLSIASDSTTSAGSSAGLGRASVGLSTSRTVSPELYATNAPTEVVSAVESNESLRSGRPTSGGPLYDPFRLPTTLSLPFGSFSGAVAVSATPALFPVNVVQPGAQPLLSGAFTNEGPPLVRKDVAGGKSPKLLEKAVRSAPIPTLVLSDDSSPEPAEADRLPFGARAGSADSDDPIALLADDAPKIRLVRQRPSQDDATPRRSRKAARPPTHPSDESDGAARSLDETEDASSEASEESGYPTVVGGSSRASSPALAGTASSDGSSPAPSMSSSPRIFQRLAAPPTVQRAKPRASASLVRKNVPSPKQRTTQKSAATPPRRGRVPKRNTPPGNTRCTLPTCPSPFYKAKAASSLKTHERNYHYPTSTLHYKSRGATIIVTRDASEHAFVCPFCPHWSLNSSSFAQHVDRLRCSGGAKP